MKSLQMLPSPQKTSLICLAVFACVLTPSSLVVAQQYADITVTNKLTIQSPSTTSTTISLFSNGAMVSLSPSTGWSASVDLGGITTNSSLLLWDPGKMAFRAGLFSETALAFVGAYSTASGYNTSASHFATAAGYYTNAGYMSFAGGQCSLASGVMSFALGDSAAALGDVSFSAGSATTALGSAAAAFGGSSLASGNYSFAMGFATHAGAHASLAIGQFNVGGFSANGDLQWNAQDPVFEVGNGTGPATRSNALTIFKSGNATFQGVVRVAPGGDIPMFAP